MRTSVISMAGWVGFWTLQLVALAVCPASSTAIALDPVETVQVPMGSFTMGEVFAEGIDAERPVHPVTDDDETFYSRAS